MNRREISRSSSSS